MASWHGTQRSSAQPSMADDITRLRGACEPGTLPPGRPGEAVPDSTPDASRDFDRELLDLDINRVLRLVDELNEYEPIMGVIASGLFHEVPRATFDALDALWGHYIPAKAGPTGYPEFWAKYVRTPAGHTLQVFCNEPPEAAS